MARMASLVLAAFVASVGAQDNLLGIWDVWQTTWDRSNLFTDISPSSAIPWVTPGPAQSADIVVSDTQTYQSVWGFGGSLTDSSALLLSQLKAANSDTYNELLSYLFDPTDGANAAGLSYLRVPLGATDFSSSVYSYDDTSGDTALTDFDINKTPSYVFDVVQDIMAVNSILKVHLCPWSPPGWMKSSGTMDGGTFETQYEQTYAEYLYKSVQGFASHGINAYAVSIQNEPQNSDTTYPTALVSVAAEAAVGTALRTLLDDNGFSYVKIIGYEHNWDDAAEYPVQLMEAAEDAFAGVAFHCYAGNVTEQAYFHEAYPDKEIYFTECSGTLGTDWWSNIKWYMDNLFIGAITYNAHSALMWNLALNGSGDPKLPTTDSCGGAGCRGIVTINSNGTYDLNEEFYSMAQASKAILPKDAGGPFGIRVGVEVQGELDWALIVGAYVTKRVEDSDWWRWSLVVLNWDDSSTTTWNPVPVNATIEFQGYQTSYVFPVGVTTLWWYAAPPSSATATGTPNGNGDEGAEQVVFRADRP